MGPKPRTGKDGIMETSRVGPITSHYNITGSSHHDRMTHPPITTLHPRRTGTPLEVPHLRHHLQYPQNKAPHPANLQRASTPLYTPLRSPMKKLYRKGTVHPSPPPTVVSDHHLDFLPSAIFTLAAALSPEEREVLDYLLSCSGTCTNGNRKAVTQKSGDHPPLFNCNCFRCYMSYWVKWDSSPNRQLIHEIIDAVEDGLVQSKNPKSRKERRRKGCSGSDELKRSELSSGKDELGRSESTAETTGNGGGGGGGDCEGCGEDGVEGLEKGSVRKFVSFLGERIWGVWTQ